MTERLEDHSHHPLHAWASYALCYAAALDVAPLDSIAADFFESCEPLKAKGVTWLVGRGMPPDALCSDADRRGWPVAAARVERIGNRFAFRDDGGRALVFVARDESGDGVDLVAWDPVADWTATLDGEVALLGQHLVYAPRDALTVHADVLSWLRAGRDGVVAVDPRRSTPLLRDAGPLLVDDAAFGVQLERKLTVRPKILVREAA